MNKAFDLWERLAIEREGIRLKAYRDTKGILTVGIGHKVLPKDNLNEGDEITRTHAYDLFEKDTERFFELAMDQASELKKTSTDFIVALISANYQLGNFKEIFPTSFNLLKQGAWQAAISNLQSSKWAQETPVRVDDLISSIRKAYDLPWWKKLLKGVIK